jgi:isopentenyl phosphate kinase
MTPVTIVKLGGSAITDKSSFCKPRLQVIQQAADQLARYSKPLIILHGGGSFAHPIVRNAHLEKGYRHPKQRGAIAETELLLDQLSRIVGISLLRKQKAIVPLNPMSFLTTKNGTIDHAFLGPVEKALTLGLTPLIHGDIAFDSTRGVSIVSADQIATLLGTRMKQARVLFGCDVDGVFSDDPRIHADAHLIEIIDSKNMKSVKRKLKGSKHADATQGMLGKVGQAVRLSQDGHKSIIFNLTTKGNLEQALLERLSRCTRFPPWKGRRSLASSR